MKQQQESEFIQNVWSFYHDNYRSMPWRENTDPYYVLVSELMLQQTQVLRVIPKFESFITQFPDVTLLASAQQVDVLAAWSGLGYNRRAKFLHGAAQQIADGYGGVIPNDETKLITLKGIGPNTARAVLAYAFNQPVVFIETNIRSVYIHEFFADNAEVNDSELLPLIEATLDKENPREWYWALMDYGSHIKRNFRNPSRRSKHHTKQSPFEGSARQIRGRIVKLLLEHDYTHKELHEAVGGDARFEEIIQQLLSENMIAQKNGRFYIP